LRGEVLDQLDEETRAIAAGAHEAATSYGVVGPSSRSPDGGPTRIKVIVARIERAGVRWFRVIPTG
jgi:hypothetical protein